MNFNWKTTVAGAFVIAASAVETFIGIDIPGFNIDFGSAMAVAMGLIFAADAKKA